MITADLRAGLASTNWYEHDASVHWQWFFPIGADALDNLTVVCLQIEADCSVPTHLDNCDELLLVVMGTIELTLGYEHARLEAGTITILPAWMPHSLSNSGAQTALLVSVLGGAEAIATFEHMVMPEREQVLRLTPPREQDGEARSRPLV